MQAICDLLDEQDRVQAEFAEQRRLQALQDQALATARSMGIRR
jgi:hypothetical protein